jgi:hypothetical protein
MGEAKRRGTFEQRKAQGIIRRQEAWAKEAEERARIKAEQRREAEEYRKRRDAENSVAPVLVAGGGDTHHHTRMLLASMAGLLAAPAPMVVLTDPLPGDKQP